MIGLAHALALGLAAAPGASEPPPDTVPEPASVEPPADAPERGARARALATHLRFGGFVQVDFLHRQISEDELDDGSRVPLNETGFLLRNARFGVDADWKYVGTRAYADFFANNQGVRPVNIDAHAQLPGKDGRPLVQLRAGLLRVPFGFENYDQTDVQRLFGERAMFSHANVPGLFDVGASLGGELWALRWIVAVHNGQPLDAPGFGFRDPNRAKDYTARLQLRGHMVSWLEASIGLSFLHGKGFSAGTPPTKDDFDWIDLNADGRVTVAELVPVPGTAGRPSESFDRWGAGTDVQLRAAVPRVGELMLYAEAALTSNLDRAISIADPVLLGRDQRAVGWYAAATQALTEWASVGIRYEQYYPDLDALEPYDGRTVITRRRFDTVTAGVAGHVVQGPLARGRLLLEYAHERNQLGRDDDGRPAQLPNDTLRVRAEVVF